MQGKGTQGRRRRIFDLELLYELLWGKGDGYQFGVKARVLIYNNYTRILDQLSLCYFHYARILDQFSLCYSQASKLKEHYVSRI